jgi:hypothetical protein
VNHQGQPLGLLLVEDQGQIRVEMVLDGEVKRQGVDVAKGDVILRMNETALLGLSQYYSMVQSTQSLVLRLRRPQKVAAPMPYFYRSELTNVSECSAAEFARRCRKDLGPASQGCFDATVNHLGQPLGLLLVEDQGQIRIEMLLDGEVNRQGIDIKKGDVILGINQRRLMGLAQYHSMVQSKMSLVLRIKRPQEAPMPHFYRSEFVNVSECSVAEFARRCGKVGQPQQPAPVPVRFRPSVGTWLMKLPAPKPPPLQNKMKPSVGTWMLPVPRLRVEPEEPQKHLVPMTHVVGTGFIGVGGLVPGFRFI